MGYSIPDFRIHSNLDHRGYRCDSLRRILEGRNSDPYRSDVFLSLVIAFPRFLCCILCDKIRYIKISRLRRAEGLAVYYPLDLSVPSGRSARY